MFPHLFDCVDRRSMTSCWSMQLWCQTTTLRMYEESWQTAEVSSVMRTASARWNLHNVQLLSMVSDILCVRCIFITNGSTMHQKYYNNNGDLWSMLTNYQHNVLYNSYVQTKSLIKTDSITLATKHMAITTISKYMPPNNSHITLHKSIQRTCH